MEFGINVHRLLGEFEDSSMEETTNTTKRERRQMEEMKFSVCNFCT